MNQTVKQKWVDALRSGNYEQGRNALRSSNNEYCCLGVLCDLAVKEGVAQERLLTYGSVSNYYYDGANALLPGSVIKWAGLDYPAVSVVYNDKPVWLNALNDAKGLTFDEIADLIEEQL